MNTEQSSDEIKVDVSKVRNISFYLILVSSVMVSLGVGLGSLVQGTIALGVFGSFLFMVGVIIYMILEFGEAKNG